MRTIDWESLHEGIGSCPINKKQVEFEEAEGERKSIYTENNSEEGKEEPWYFYSVTRRPAGLAWKTCLRSIENKL